MSLNCCLIMPVAILESALNGAGELVGINNISQYNDLVGQPSEMRKAEWYLFRNGRLAYTWGIDYLNIPLSIGGTRAAMTFAQSTQTIVNFLTANNIPYDRSYRIEIAATVVNVSGYRSEMSNKILIVAAPVTDCCDADIYELRIGGARYCFANRIGDCYKPQ